MSPAPRLIPSGLLSLVRSASWVSIYNQRSLIWVQPAFGILDRVQAIARCADDSTSLCSYALEPYAIAYEVLKWLFIYERNIAAMGQGLRVRKVHSVNVLFSWRARADAAATQFLICLPFILVYWPSWAFSSQMSRYACSANSSCSVKFPSRRIQVFQIRFCESKLIAGSAIVMLSRDSMSGSSFSNQLAVMRRKASVSSRWWKKVETRA